jgi:hypothetical protein
MAAIKVLAKDLADVDMDGALGPGGCTSWHSEGRYPRAWVTPSGPPGPLVPFSAG